MRPALKNLESIKRLKGAEIGVGDGKHALKILKNLDIVKLYLIDPYIHYGNYKGKRAKKEYIAKNILRDWNDKIVWIKKFSDDAASHIRDGELDFVYIDGNHEYIYVLNDINNYYHKVKDGGLICGHDYNHRAVRTAVNEIFGDVNYQRTVDGKNVKDWWIWKKIK